MNENKTLQTFKFQGLDPIFPVIEVDAYSYEQGYQKALEKLQILKQVNSTTIQNSSEEEKVVNEENDSENKKVSQKK